MEQHGRERRTGWPGKPARTCSSTRHNPVDWHPWGREALELARASGKPILLSIGYSACHWCHVMAHESFEDAATAALMNELFVNIKVDREERPDIDKIYQFAHQVLTQRGGGWPLTMFLTHDDQKPFFGGTYFPDKARYGMPAFATLLKRVAEYYREQRDGSARAERHVDGRVRRSHAGARRRQRRRSRAAPLDGARATARATFDKRYGGFGDAPKFPHPGIDRPAHAPLACHRRRRRSRTCTRCSWPRSRSRAWPKAACTTSSAAASRVTRSTSSG